MAKKNVFSDPKVETLVSKNLEAIGKIVVSTFEVLETRMDCYQFRVALGKQNRAAFLEVKEYFEEQKIKEEAAQLEKKAERLASKKARIAARLKAAQEKVAALLEKEAKLK